ncbi:MAG: host attachment protein [Myxococcales bacterium]|nr:host attachment protein [Myxococcales bacterium]MDH3484404.1 host attachment protein [Myxococcales bacterium]
MASTWVLVAHEAGARVFENSGPGKGLRFVEGIDHPEGRLQDGDFNADRPGRSFRRDAGDVRRAAMSRSEGPHEHAVSDFARALANRLQHARTMGQYDRLVLVAPPKFLGLLRSSIDAPTERCVVGSLDKDLAASDEAELVRQLGKVIAV